MSATEPAAPGADAVTLEFALMEREFVEANLRVSRGRIRRGTMLYGALAVGWALGVASGALPLKLVAWMLPLVYGINAVSTCVGARYRLRRAFRSQGAKQAVSRVTLSPDGYRGETGGTEVFIRWPVFSHYEETPTAFLLYQGPLNALVLPKSALTDAQQREVPELLRRWIGRSGPTGRPGFPIASPGSPA